MSTTIGFKRLREDLQTLDNRSLAMQRQHYEKNPGDLHRLVSRVFRTLNAVQLNQTQKDALWGFGYLCTNRLEGPCSFRESCGFSHNFPLQVALKLLFSNNYKSTPCKHPSTHPSLGCDFYHPGDPQRADARDPSIRGKNVSRPRTKQVQESGGRDSSNRFGVLASLKEDLLNLERPVSPSDSEDESFLAKKEHRDLPKRPPELPTLTDAILADIINDLLPPTTGGTKISLALPFFTQRGPWGSEIRNNDPWVQQQPPSNIEEDRKDNTTHLGQERELAPSFSEFPTEADVALEEESPRVRRAVTLQDIVEFDLYGADGSRMRSIERQQGEARLNPHKFRIEVKKAQDLFRQCTEELPNPHWKLAPCKNHIFCPQKDRCDFAHNFAVSAARGWMSAKIYATASIFTLPFQQ